MNARITAVAGIGFLALCAAPAMAQDASRGEGLYQVCSACHSLDEGVNGVGPSLAGVLDRASASVDGFGYSNAMNAAGLVWDEETLAIFIADAAGLVPNTSMGFPGVGNEQDAKDIAAFLAAQ